MAAPQALLRPRPFTHYPAPAVPIDASQKPLTVQEEAKMTGMLTGAKDW